MKRNAFMFVIAGCALALAAWQLIAADGSDGVAASAPTTPATTNATTNAGYKVYLDENGQIVEAPAASTAEDFSAALEEYVNTSSEGLVEEATPVGDGVKVDLQGRFQSTSVAKVDVNGTIIAPCLTNETEARAFASSTAAQPAAEKE